MGLKETFRNAAKTALKASGNVPKDVRYLSIASSIYDTSTGVASTIGRNHFFSMIFVGYKQSEVDDVHIKPTDVQGLFAQIDAPNVTPAMHDSVFICEAYGSTEYEVKDIKADPADALWMLQLRARGKGQL